jgi:hypothetical protein
MRSRRITRAHVRPVFARGVVAALIALTSAIVVGLVHPRAAQAEPPRFLGEVDRNQVAVGDAFVYQVTLSLGNDQVSDYRPPDFKGLRVLSRPSGPNQSTQMQFGGAGMFVEVSYSWRYEVAATQKGSVSIGPARVRVNGQEFRSSVVTVAATGNAASATPAGPPPLPNNAAASATPADPGSATPPAAVSPAGLPPEANDGASFIRLVTDKQKVFVGEALVATWYLYMNQAADKYETHVEPHTEGFWSEDIVVPSRRGSLVLTQETVQGRTYQVGAVLKKALFPLQAGRPTITPMEAEIARSDFFGNAVRSQNVRSVPTVIEVLPLPKAGQPTGFDAANVGTFTLAAHVDRAQVAVGEAVTLTIELAGRGNIRKVSPPVLPKLAGWKAYEPRVNVVVDSASGVTGNKTVEILLLPEQAGAVTLPALVLNTFDPDAHRYVAVETAPIALTATGSTAVGAHGGADGTPSPAGSGTFSENVIAGQIRPLHPRGSLRRNLGTTFFHTRGFAGAVLVPPMGLVLALIAFRLRDRMSADTGSRRRKRARQKVRAHLAAADRYRQRGQIAEFFIEIDRVVRAALAARLGRPVQGLRMDELGALLTARGLAVADVARVIVTLEECDRARFAGSVNSADEGDTLGPALERANDLIDVIEKAPLSDEARA